MTLAEELAKKYGLPTVDTPMVENEDHRIVPKWPHVVQHKSVIPAINEAMERCAAVAETYRDKTCSDNYEGQHAKSACGFVAMRIRALKDESDPPPVG